MIVLEKLFIEVLLYISFFGLSNVFLEIMKFDNLKKTYYYILLLIIAINLLYITNKQ